MKSPFKHGSNKLPDPQVKGDFNALLNADSGKSATKKQAPVLLDLRKSGSFKPQSSLDSAASFATAPSYSSDKVSEAAGPTHSSSAFGTTVAGDSSPVRPVPTATHASAGDQLVREQSNNGIAEGARPPAAGARQGPSEATSAARDHSHNSRGLNDMQGIKQQSSSSNAAPNVSTSDAKPVEGPLGKRQPDSSSSQRDVPPTPPPDLGRNALAAESRSLEGRSTMSEQWSSTPAAQAQQAMAAGERGESQDQAVTLLGSLSLSRIAHAGKLPGSATAKDIHPLEPHTPDALVISPEPSGGPRQDLEKVSATLPSPLQSSTREALRSAADGAMEPSSGTAASQTQPVRSDSQELTPQDSRSDTRLHRTSEEAGRKQSTKAHEQASSTACQEHSEGAQRQAKSASDPRQAEEVVAWTKAAESGERSDNAQGQLSTASGQEASEELPVSTLGARCLSEVLAASLPEPDSSAAGGSPAADAGAPGHDVNMDEHHKDHMHGQQDSDPEGEELKDWRPVIQGSSSLSDLPQEPDQAKQSTELPGAASLGSSAAYELEPVEPHGGDPEDAATLQQPHHVWQASTFTESLGGHTGSEAGTAPGDLEDDYSLITPSEASSAAIAAPGVQASAMQRAASGATSLGRAATHAAAEVLQQDEHSAEWRTQRKHFFVLTNAGRPVFTAHGNEHALAGFMAIIDAMMSFVKDRGDSLHSMRAGKHLIVFLERGPLYLVAVSSAAEPESALRLQLELLHAHLLAILTDNFDKMLARNPRFEPRRLLGGTEDVLRRFLRSFESSPAAMLGAWEPLHLPAAQRHSTLVSLQSAVKRSDAMYGVLLAGERVVALAQPRAHALHAHDLLLLSSFVLGSDSFRAAAESFSPICLPHFNPTAFLHAYVRFLDEASGLCLVLLSKHQDAFHGLSDGAKRLQAELQGEGTTQVIARILGRQGSGRLCLDRLPRSAGGGVCGETALHHFLYRATARAQFVMPAFSAPLDLPELRQEVMPAYARAHAAVHDGQGAICQRVHFCRTDQRAVLAYVGAEYEVYAQFDALTDRSSALTMCQRLCTYIKNQHSDLFVPLSL